MKEEGPLAWQQAASLAPNDANVGQAGCRQRSRPQRVPPRSFKWRFAAGMGSADAATNERRAT